MQQRFRNQEYEQFLEQDIRRIRADTERLERQSRGLGSMFRLLVVIVIGLAVYALTLREPERPARMSGPSEPRGFAVPPRPGQPDWVQEHRKRQEEEQREKGAGN